MKLFQAHEKCIQVIFYILSRRYKLDNNCHNCISWFRYYPPFFRGLIKKSTKILLFALNQMTSTKQIILFFVAFVNFPALISGGSHKSKELSKVVQNIVKNEGIPSVLWIKSCWSKIDEINFVKNTAIPVQIATSTTSIDLSFDDEVVEAQWFFVDISCERNSDFLSNVQNRYFAHPYRWIIAGADSYSIQNLTLLPDSNVIIAHQNTGIKEYDLKQGSMQIIIFEFFCIFCFVSVNSL